MNLCIVGYPALAERHFKMLEEMAKFANVTAIVPARWTKIRLSTVPIRKTDVNVKIMPAEDLPNKIPLVGGLFKELMPSVYSNVKNMKADILYSLGEEWYPSTFYNLSVAKILGIKHVCFAWWIYTFSKKALLDSLRGGMGLSGYPFGYFVQKLNIKLSDGVIVPNTRAKEVAEKLGAKKIATLPLAGVDVKRFNPKLPGTYKEKLGLSNKVVILFVGRLVYQKGPHILIGSAKQIIKEKKDVHFILCGAGELEGELKRLVQMNNLGDFVTFIKWIPYNEMPFLYASADILASPSIPTPRWEEGFGYMNLEANACGKPVVSTLSGGIPEMVKDKESGLLVPPRDEKALAIALLTLIKNRRLRREMGKEGRKIVEKKFSNEVIAKKTIEFFESLLEAE